MRTALTFDGPLGTESAQTGKLWKGLATVLVKRNVLLTKGSSHAQQIGDYAEKLAPALGVGAMPDALRTTLAALTSEAVCLFVDPAGVQIRPEPDRMELACDADEKLQQHIPKWKIRYLYSSHPKVIDAMRRRGELWRIAPLPRTRAEIIGLIEESRTALGGEAIYYHNRITGTRFLTCTNFAGLGHLGDDALRRHLAEIASHSQKRNLSGNLEVAFFNADAGISPQDFAKVDWAGLDAAALRREYARLAHDFRGAVSHECATDDVENAVWRREMYTALVSPPDEPLSDHVLDGLSPEMFLAIEWLVGAAFDSGELIIDPVFDAFETTPNDTRLARVCDQRVPGFIRNFHRELGDLEYINLGRVISEPRPGKAPREVYVAEAKPVGGERQVKVIRMQRSDIRQNLQRPNWDTLSAILWANDYTHFILNRRLACRQLGMHLVPRMTMGQIMDPIRLPIPGSANDWLHAWATYFVRDFVWGMSTDKIPKYKLADDAYSLRLARLMGAAAAVNLLVGRVDDHRQAVFDAGDEIVQEGLDGTPARIVVTDHAGTFFNYESDLKSFAKAYARPVNVRATAVPRRRRFADTYLSGLRSRFVEVQSEYARRPEAFDRMFRGLRSDPRGAFADRWQAVLQRLKQTNVDELCQEIRAHITFQ